MFILVIIFLSTSNNLLRQFNQLDVNKYMYTTDLCFITGSVQGSDSPGIQENRTVHGAPAFKSPSCERNDTKCSTAGLHGGWFTGGSRFGVD